MVKIAELAGAALVVMAEIGGTLFEDGKEHWDADKGGQEFAGHQQRIPVVDAASGGDRVGLQVADKEEGALAQGVGLPVHDEISPAVRDKDNLVLVVKVRFYAEGPWRHIIFHFVLPIADGDILWGVKLRDHRLLLMVYWL